MPPASLQHQVYAELLAVLQLCPSLALVGTVTELLMTLVGLWPLLWEEGELVIMRILTL